MITLQHKRGTAAQWTSLNPVLASGEIGVETDTNKFKIGNGTSTWSSLAYQGGGSSPASPTVRGTVYGLTDDDAWDNGSTALGWSTLNSLTSGLWNTAVGFNALSSTTIGLASTAVGYNALKNNIDGDNTAVGYIALQSNTTGYGNTAISGLWSNTTGTFNTAVGVNALGDNTTGHANNSLGYESLRANTTGNWNNAFGQNALWKNTTGYYNTAMGDGALFFNTTGYGNTAVGAQAFAGSTGHNNTVIGYNASSSSFSVSNEITLGDSGITTLRCAVTSITSISDARDKKDISTLTFGKDFISQLKPVEFTWDTRDGNKVGIKDFGFVAQDIVELEDSLDAHDVLGLTLRENPDKLEVTQGRLIPILVKAIQELSEEIAELKEQINNANK